METSSNITIEAATPSDAISIWQLETLVYGEEVTSKYDTPMFVRYGYVYVAKDVNNDDKIVGAIQAMKTKDNTIKINNWYVHPEYQRKGIGQKLYERLLQDVDEDIIAIVLEDNHSSYQAHLKLGFVAEEELPDPYLVGKKGTLFRFSNHR